MQAKYRVVVIIPEGFIGEGLPDKLDIGIAKESEDRNSYDIVEIERDCRAIFFTLKRFVGLARHMNQKGY